MANGEFDLAGWSGYFDTIIQLLEEADRQYGVANQQYTQYICLGALRFLCTHVHSAEITDAIRWGSTSVPASTG